MIGHPLDFIVRIAPSAAADSGGSSETLNPTGLAPVLPAADVADIPPPNLPGAVAIGVPFAQTAEDNESSPAAEEIPTTEAFVTDAVVAAVETITARETPAAEEALPAIAETAVPTE